MPGIRAGAAVLVVALAGCGGGGGSRSASEAAPKACAPAPVRTAAPPRFARLPEVPPPPMPYATDTSGDVVAFFFTQPLRARMGPRYQNKILWVVGRKVQAEPLRIAARSGSRVVRASGDAGGGSGQIQRTGIRLPRAGCWRLSLRWGERRSTLDVHVAGPKGGAGAGKG